MAQEIFKRYEKKYILDETTYRYLFFRLAEKMSQDSYGEHTISNVYFDTPEYELIRCVRKSEGGQHRLRGAQKEV